MKRPTEKTPTHAALLEMLREDYMRRVEAFAEELRPGFESGELHGWDARDSEGDDRDVAYVTAMEKITGAAWERFLKHSPRESAIVVACSPSVGPIRQDKGRLTEAIAVMCVYWDVLRVARAQRWYKPARGEQPSTAELNRLARRAA